MRPARLRYRRASIGRLKARSAHSVRLASRGHDFSDRAPVHLAFSRLAPVEGSTRVDYAVGFALCGWIEPLEGILLWKFRPLFEKALPNPEEYLLKG